MDIPEKFQNDDGSLNADAIIKSYSELEHKIGTMISVPTEDSDDAQREKFRRATGVPESPNDYPTNPLFDDETIRKKFFDAGLSAPQVQKIYDVANDFLSPALSEMFERKYEYDAMDELKTFFGGTEKMRENIIAINTFAEKFLPADVYESLSSSPAGIRSIYAMMQSMEPQIQTENSNAKNLSDSSLRDAMRDPKYWRDRDPEYVRKIETGFKKLYA